MSVRRTAATLGLAGGLLLLGPAAWAEDGSGTTPSASAEPSTAPSPDPTTSASDEPTTEPTSTPTDEPTGQPTDEPTSKPTDGPTGEPPDSGGVCHGSDGTVTSDGGTTSADPAAGDPPSDPQSADPAPDDPKGEPATDNNCIYYASGAGAGGSAQDSAGGAGAVERDAKNLGSGAAELPRTGGRTDVLALVAVSMLAAGGMSILVGRRSAA